MPVSRLLPSKTTALVAALALSGAAGLRAGLPVISLDETRATDGITRSFRGWNSEGAWLFKLDAPCCEGLGVYRKHANFEAEFVAHGIFQALGIQAPRPRVVKVAGRGGRFLALNWFPWQSGPDLSGSGVVSSEELDLEEDAGTLDEDMFRRVAIVDMLLANFDRHDENLLAIPGEDGLWKPVPIDHDLALLTRRWSRRTGLARRSLVTQKRSVLRRALDANGLLRDLRRQEGSRERYPELAREVAEALPDPLLTRIVRRIPVAALPAGKADQRREELLELLIHRRDELEAAVRKVSR